MLGLTGCASVKRWFGPGDEPAAAAAPRPVVAVYRLEVEAPSELRTLLNTYLDLARFQNAPESEDITPAEVDRLIAAAPAQVRSLLETEGYFNPAVRVARVGAAAGV
ncbi:MAG: outer membrane protein assembly factor, partial [Burkholderiaceae bacterium]|nr:outer membrane protein assembly factor [Burkholderiaceae bacterium]